LDPPDQPLLDLDRMAGTAQACHATIVSSRHPQFTQNFTLSVHDAMGLLQTQPSPNDDSS
jgi:hypothetical protein